METNYIFLSSGQLLFASLLMAVNIGLSIVLKLGLTKQWGNHLLENGGTVADGWIFT